MEKSRQIQSSFDSGQGQRVYPELALPCTVINPAQGALPPGATEIFFALIGSSLGALSYSANDGDWR
jgi:hypothetical protein